MSAVEIKEHFRVTLYGFSGRVEDHDYPKKLRELCQRLWKIVKDNRLPHKGQEHWVYEPNQIAFVGLEFHQPLPESLGLEQKTMEFIQYGYYKHIGPWDQICQAGFEMRNELLRRGFDINQEFQETYLEIYGPWTDDASKRETELLINLVRE